MTLPRKIFLVHNSYILVPSNSKSTLTAWPQLPKKILSWVITKLTESDSLCCSAFLGSSLLVQPVITIINKSYRLVANDYIMTWRTSLDQSTCKCFLPSPHSFVVMDIDILQYISTMIIIAECSNVHSTIHTLYFHLKYPIINLHHPEMILVPNRD